MAKAKRGNSATAEQPAPEAEAHAPAVNGNGHHGTNGDGKKNGPAQEWRFGRIRLVAWLNANDKGRWYSFVLTRGYKDGQGNWQNSSSLGVMDLLPAGLLFSQAFIWTQQQYRNAKRAEAAEANGYENGGIDGDGGGMGDDSIPF